MMTAIPGVPDAMAGAAVVTDRDFTRFRAWLQKTSGIFLGDGKKSLVAGRLGRRLRVSGAASIGQYLDLVMEGPDEAERQTALDLLTTNETYFFREPGHFEFLRREILPSLRGGRAVRLWSAASSTGEEAYGMAMTCAAVLGEAAWEVRGSDISTRVLDTARRAQYPIERAERIPRELLARHCLRGTGAQAGTFLIDRSLRARVSFTQVNLNRPLPALGRFQVIFLRNVMIYFDLATKQEVVERMLPLLEPGGHFIIGHSESLNGVTDGLRMLRPSIYVKP